VRPAATSRRGAAARTPVRLDARLAVVLAALATAAPGLAWTDPEPQPRAEPKFDPVSRLGGGGALVGGPLACTASDRSHSVRVRIRVTLAQRSARAAGDAVWTGCCSKTSWRLGVPGARPFRAGPVQACALGVQRTPSGAVWDVRLWCQTLRLAA
jgi:hypothetical protein